MGGNSGADTERQPAATNLAKQVRKEYAPLVKNGATDPIRTQGADSDLLTDPFPVIGVRAGTRPQRHVMLRFARKRGVLEGLAKIVREQCRVAEVRQGRSDRPYAEGAGGFPEYCGPIRFRARGAAHLRDLA